MRKQRQIAKISAPEIHHIDVQLFRRVSVLMHHRVYQSLKESGFAGSACTIQSNVTCFCEIYGQGLLLLSSYEIDKANRGRAQSFIATFQGVQNNLFGKHIKPQRLCGNTFFLTERNNFSNNRFKLGFIGFCSGQINFCTMNWIGCVIRHMYSYFFIRHVRLCWNIVCPTVS